MLNFVKFIARILGIDTYRDNLTYYFLIYIFHTARTME